ncbi:hypothetical protein XJ44_08880 [Thermosipho affectus]|uniref:Uncharacterized protein n=1 Tax=Thermosipho affectus TaxID=660294 RepID=A0ABX3IFF8_9BACT|nr:hypothetical protein XJ44_08880 [Thermosipho affectus]
MYIFVHFYFPLLGHFYFTIYRRLVKKIRFFVDNAPQNDKKEGASQNDRKDYALFFLFLKQTKIQFFIFTTFTLHCILFPLSNIIILLFITFSIQFFCKFLAKRHMLN